MDEILNNPVKVWMLIILLAMYISSIIFLIVMWRKACKEAKEREE